MNTTRLAGIVAVAAVAAPSASAAFDSFDNRGAWQTAATTAGITLDGFESFESFPSSDNTFFPSLDADGFTVSSFDVDFDFLDPLTVQNSASGGAPTDGNQLLSVSSFAETETEFIFDSPVLAVGFDLIDFGDFNNQNSTIEITLFNGDTETIFSGQGTSGNSAFFGFLADAAITGFTIRNNFRGDQFAFDAVTFGVPTPGAAALAAVAGLAATRRRR